MGSTSNIKRLSRSDTFESGKVYRMDVEFKNQDSYRFAEGFTISFKQMDGSDSNYAMLSVGSNTARKQSRSVWYTVGTVADPQPITNVTITGPALQSDGTVGTTNPADFNVTGGAVISNVVRNMHGSG